MERVRIKLRYCLPLLVCFLRCLHASQGTANYFLHFMFCSIFCLIWGYNSDQQSYANDKIIFVVIGYKKVWTFSNKGLHQESSDEMWMMNMVEETFSYLNISKINSAEVQNDGECAFACLKEPMCFSYNLEASASKTGTRVCELLPSDKYNNSDEVIISQKFHHYSIQVSDLMFNIKKKFYMLWEKCPWGKVYSDRWLSIRISKHTLRGSHQSCTNKLKLMSLEAFLASWVLSKPLKCFISPWTRH